MVAPTRHVLAPAIPPTGRAPNPWLRDHPAGARQPARPFVRPKGNPWVRQPLAAAPKRLAPALHYKVRGRAPIATLDDAERSTLLEELDADVLANSTAASRASNLRTWTLFHVRWFGAARAPLPLVPLSLRAVAAQMKAAGYRSFPNYVVAAKAEHLKLHSWDDALERCKRQCIQSTQRGIGPCKQAVEIPVRELASLGLGDRQLVDDGPLSPGAWAILSSFHMTRGAESACALASSLTVDNARRTESWFLPVSKTDPTARGCLRTWGCVCGEGLAVAVAPLCPYHAALSHRALLVERFGLPDGSLPVDLPLFPTSRGEWCSKAGFTGTIRAIAVSLGVTTEDALGRNVIGEHAWRVSGSRYLASLDVPIPIIKLLARWGSDTVLRYVADAPLSALTRIYLDRVHLDGMAARSTRAAAVEALHDAVHITEAIDDQADLESPDTAAPGSPPLPFFQSRRTGKVHLVALPPFIDIEGATTTLCQWDIATDSGVQIPVVPVGAHRCARCGSPAVWAMAVSVASHLVIEDDQD